MVSGIVLTQQQKPGKTEPMFRRLLGRLWFNLAVDMVSDFQLNIRRTKRMKMCFGNWRAKGRSKTTWQDRHYDLFHTFYMETGTAGEGWKETWRGFTTLGKNHVVQISLSTDLLLHRRPNSFLFTCIPAKCFLTISVSALSAE